jgi:Tat protein translocase TatB subunit
MTLAFLFDSVGFGEWFVLLAVVLIVVGPKRLPSAARTLGQYYSKFRRAADNFKRQLLDMDTEFTQAAESVQKAADDAFTVADGTDKGAES